MEPKCTPPPSLLKFDTSLFVGFDPAATDKTTTGRKGLDPAASQLEDMVNSMLPPR